ncbi:hypothetical protein BDR26DRAFT_41765 [Obelidium mucronatum]|nr:hypothetical protein BDR26DRAFT_41765 [Obelidium mucronatum]
MGPELLFHSGTSDCFTEHSLTISQTFNINLQTIDIGLETIDIGLETIDIGLETIDIGLETIHVSLETIHVGLDISLETTHISFETFSNDLYTTLKLSKPSFSSVSIPAISSRLAGGVEEFEIFVVYAAVGARNRERIVCVLSGRKKQTDMWRYVFDVFSHTNKKCTTQSNTTNTSLNTVNGL